MKSKEYLPKRKEQILAQQAYDTTVLLNPHDGQYYSLDGVGCKIWDLCDGTHSVTDMVSIICEEYDAPFGIIEADVLELLEDLVNQKLVFKNAEVADHSDPAAQSC